MHNPLQQLTGALPVYGGDFFETPRSEWDFDTLEQEYSVPRAMEMFENSISVGLRFKLEKRKSTRRLTVHRSRIASRDAQHVEQ